MQTKNSKPINFVWISALREKKLHLCGRHEVAFSLFLIYSAILLVQRSDLFLSNLYNVCHAILVWYLIFKVLQK